MEGSHTMIRAEVLLPKEEVVLVDDDCETSEDPISITEEQGKVKLGTHDKEDDGDVAGPGEEAETLAEIEREVLAIHCGLCNYVTNKGWNLRRHNLLVHEEHKELAEEKLAGDKNAVRKKKKISSEVSSSTMEHPVGDRIQCPKCPATFSKANSKGNNSLKRHLQSIHTTLCYTCDLCGKTFGRKDALKLHKSRLHSKQDGSKNIAVLKKSKLDHDLPEHLKVEERIIEQSPDLATKGS